MKERAISFIVGAVIGAILCFGYFTFFKSGPAGFVGPNGGFEGRPGMMRESGSGSQMRSGSTNVNSQNINSGVSE